MDFELQLAELDANLVRLHTKFVQPHLAALNLNAENFELDVKSYCVLTHALFEQYAEDLCFTVVENAYTAWNTPCRKIGRVLACLILFSSKSMSSRLDKPEQNDRCCDILRKQVDDAKVNYFNYLWNNNHGFSEDHLRKLLWPIGLELPNDIRLLESLRQLTKNRGFHAHKYDIKKVLDPKEVANWTKDCRELLKDLTDSAKAIQADAPGPIKRGLFGFLKWK